ncbi:hypothetical protein [Streptomyces sp. 135]|uniref:hypothetical protein n=1 Tax=Streptomyces sp. 135 TaxID=2838850 RepID=UPI001CBEB0BA|nr:hypothetical protein [Streptomyces sp. 135]
MEFIDLGSQRVMMDLAVVVHLYNSHQHDPWRATVAANVSVVCMAPAFPHHWNPAHRSPGAGNVDPSHHPYQGVHMG